MNDHEREFLSFEAKRKNSYMESLLGLKIAIIIKLQYYAFHVFIKYIYAQGTSTLVNDRKRTLLSFSSKRKNVSLTKMHILRTPSIHDWLFTNDGKCFMLLCIV